MPDGVSVAELCQSIEGAIADVFPDEVWVRGAISGLNRSAAGHVYFNLVDPGELGGTPKSVIAVALFAKSKFTVNAILRKSGGAIRMQDGVEIQLRGRVAFYGKTGRVQLIMSLIDPAFTLGQLEVARATLLAKLTAEGLLERNGSIPLSPAPLRLALITSSGSAAAADFLEEISASGLPFAVDLYDSRVQGEEAVESLAAQIDAASKGVPGEAGHTRYDVIAVVRGGGARTDLVAFDHEQVARAIACSTVPVLVGIGHEIDRSVADEVAAFSTKTPTACAAFLVERVRIFARRIDQRADEIAQAAERHLDLADQRLDRIERAIDRFGEDVVRSEAHHLDGQQRRLVTAVERGLANADHRLREAELRIRALDPAVAIARGWSITHDGDGRLVRSVTDLEPGQTIITTLPDGAVTSVVEDAGRTPA